jgi:hypothetical protein
MKHKEVKIISNYPCNCPEINEAEVIDNGGVFKIHQPCQGDIVNENVVKNTKKKEKRRKQND